MLRLPLPSFRSPSLTDLASLIGSGIIVAGCAATSASAPPAESSAAPASPFTGIAMYRAPYSNAENAQKQAEKDNPGDAALIGKIAAQPQASWFGNWSGDIRTSVANYVNAAEREGKLAVLVAYNVPNRDCGQYSSGGATDSSAYGAWIRGFADGIGDRRAVVVLEPDAIPLLKQCLSEADQAKRLELIRDAVEVLEARPGVDVYIDAGHSNWVPVDEMAERLKLAGIAKARGFSLNVSNFEPDDKLIAYGRSLVAKLGGDKHFVIDSSRNGNGPAPSSVNEFWCNPEGRALGRPPSGDTGVHELDAFIWIKRPGESDGECKSGPPAGQWFQARAVEMARNAKW